MANNGTIFQRLGKALMGTSVPDDIVTTSRNFAPTNQVLFSTNDKNEYERKLSQYRQQKLLSYQWVKAGQDTNLESLAGYTAVKLMYRDADLMDAEPEIGSAMDIIADEACTIDSKNVMLKVYSKSGRIKSILDDLFFNRLDVNTWLPMIARATFKYGNEFMLLNLSKDEGVMGWKELPVYEIDRLENGFSTVYSTNIIGSNDIKPDEIKFVWIGHNESTPYQNYQIAHFRLLNDSVFLPYGTSGLHKARRAWRMWSMMEDGMLIRRLERSIERRVFKIFVGGINDADVPAYIQDVANNFKRTPIIDPATGQVDLRKNFLDVSADYFIPVRDYSQPTPIETLQGAQDQTSMDDIKYMQNKIFAALRVPKSFLNFEDASQSKGQNLSVNDVRFSRMINRLQQYLILELNKIAMIHLFLLGITDELTNFTITLQNPSSQIKSAELDDITKRISTLQTALADPGNGIPMMSLHRGLKDIMGMTDKEIKDMLEEIRLEKAMAAELAATQNIIKKTGIFDPVDRIYGDFDAMHNPQAAMQQQGGEQGGMGGLGGGGPLGGGPLGGGPSLLPPSGGDFDMDMGAPGGDEGPDLSGGDSDMDMGSAPNADAGQPSLMEQIGKSLLRNIKEDKNRNIRNGGIKTAMDKYFEMLDESSKKEPDYIETPDDTSFEEKNASLKIKADNILGRIDELIKKTDTDDSEDSGLTKAEIDALKE